MKYEITSQASNELLAVKELNPESLVGLFDNFTNEVITKADVESVRVTNWIRNCIAIENLPGFNVPVKLVAAR